MKNSSNDKPASSDEARVARIRQLQEYMMSDVYPTGMNRGKAAQELMKLRNTRKKRKKEEGDVEH